MWRRERAAAARLKYEEHVAALKAPPAPRPPSRYSMSFGRSIGAAPAPAEPRRKAARPSLTSVTAYREVTRDDSPSPPPAPRSSTPRASTVAPQPPAAAAELRGRAQAVESSDSAPRSDGAAVERRTSSAAGVPGFDWAAVVGIFQARGRCVLRGRLARVVAEPAACPLLPHAVLGRIEARLRRRLVACCHPDTGSKASQAKRKARLLSSARSRIHCLLTSTSRPLRSAAPRATSRRSRSVAPLPARPPPVGTRAVSAQGDAAAEGKRSCAGAEGDSSSSEASAATTRSIAPRTPRTSSEAPSRAGPPSRRSQS